LHHPRRLKNLLSAKGAAAVEVPGMVTEVPDALRPEIGIGIETEVGEERSGHGVAVEIGVGGIETEGLVPGHGRGETETEEDDQDREAKRKKEKSKRNLCVRRNHTSVTNFLQQSQKWERYRFKLKRVIILNSHQVRVQIHIWMMQLVD
jgi:hypothetical protein